MLICFFKAQIKRSHSLGLKPSLMSITRHLLTLNFILFAQKVLLPFFMVLYMLLSGDVIPQTVALLVNCFLEYEYVSWHKLYHRCLSVCAGDLTPLRALSFRPAVGFLLPDYSNVQRPSFLFCVILVSESLIKLNQQNLEIWIKRGYLVEKVCFTWAKRLSGLLVVPCPDTPVRSWMPLWRQLQSLAFCLPGKLPAADFTCSWPRSTVWCQDGCLIAMNVHFP